MRRGRNYRKPGQSMILLAFLITFLIGMIALAVDVGNAFGKQRRIQSVSNAGALAGMGSVMAGKVNSVVWADVQRALAGNRVGAVPSFSYRVDYIMDDERVELLGEWNGSVATVRNGASLPPQNLVRVQITMREDVNTYFARVIGQEQFTVNANAVACLGDYGIGVYPLGVPVALRPAVIDNKGKEQTPGHQVWDTSGNEVLPGNTAFGDWQSGMYNKIVRLPVANNNDFISGVHISWLNWGGDTQTVDGVTYQAISGLKGASALDAAFTKPGTLHKGFMEAASPDPSKPNTKPMRKLQRGDWISGDPGVKASLKDELEEMRRTKTQIMLPFYDIAADGNGSKSAYHMVNMGKFKVVAHELNGSPKYIDLLFEGYASVVPEACGSEGLPTTPDKRFNIHGVASVNRVWRTQAASSVTRDIVIVMDTSRSMEWDWQDRMPGESGYQSANARIAHAKATIRDFVQNYDLSPETGDPDARVALITFGGAGPGRFDYAEGSSMPSGFDPAPVQVGWSQACASELLEFNCNGAGNKWSEIQAKANAMTPRGLTPGPIAFERVEALLSDRRSPPSGKRYEQIVIFATDGVFNVCGQSAGTESCPFGAVVPFDGSSTNAYYYLNNPGYNAVSGRPVWQAQQVASRIRANGARVFVLALTPACLPGSTTCFDTTGLKDMSNGTDYYYQADSGQALQQIFATIRHNLASETCVPQEVTQLAPGARVMLKRPDNPTWIMQTTTDSAGAYVFQNLAAGEYVVRVEPSLSLTSAEDGRARTYSRLRNNLSLSEEDQASVYLNPQYPNGTTVHSRILLSLPLSTSGAPHNGCTMPSS